MDLKTLSAVDLKQICREHGPYQSSPLAWEDQVLYFLMPDRFSNNQEQGYKNLAGHTVNSGSIPMYTEPDNGNAVKTEAEAKQWRNAGAGWMGGNLKGLTTKIGYLTRLGITAVWISPIFRQVAFRETYHGYGIQNFLDVDHQFGSREDLKKLVETAHAHGIYVILDIILNHTGNVFSYSHDRMYYWQGNQYNVRGYNNKQGSPVIPFQRDVPGNAWPDGAVWPREFQNPATFTRKGEIRYWDNYPEYLDGDFYDLKDISLGERGRDEYDYSYSRALLALAEVYKYWIAYADIDGFRVDTVKHMDKGATRFFSSAIHEFTQSIGKENFYLIGEITGGRSNAFTTMEMTGLNAALGINEIPGKLEGVAKGYTSPVEYFELFRHSLRLGKDSHTWLRNKVVTMFDDHDQVRKGNRKARFCADGHGDRLILPVMALNLLSEGIPCLYYGTEQGFDGSGGNDRYLREAMFGGDFGAFRSRDRHFFNETHPVYRGISGMIKIRQEYKGLRRGRQYLRQISGDGIHFGYPEKIGSRLESIIAWSRIFNNQEILVAINTDHMREKTAWVTVDGSLHAAGSGLDCIYASDPPLATSRVAVAARNGKAVQLRLPPGGVMIYI